MYQTLVTRFFVWGRYWIPMAIVQLPLFQYFLRASFLPFLQWKIYVDLESFKDELQLVFDDTLTPCKEFIKQMVQWKLRYILVHIIPIWHILFKTMTHLKMIEKCLREPFTFLIYSLKNFEWHRKKVCNFSMEIENFHWRWQSVIKRNSFCECDYCGDDIFLRCWWMLTVFLIWTFWF